MPELHAAVRAQGGHAAAEPWPDHDWTVLADAATLRHRVLPKLDQSRYGHATDDPPRYGTDGRPSRSKS